MRPAILLALLAACDPIDIGARASQTLIATPPACTPDEVAACMSGAGTLPVECGGTACDHDCAQFHSRAALSADRAACLAETDCFVQADVQACRAECWGEQAECFETATECMADCDVEAVIDCLMGCG